MKNRQPQSPSASRPRNVLPPPILPEDTIVEILSWLPVKSLMQFTCVCKLWKSVISDPNFVKLHLHRSTTTKANLLLLWAKDSHDVFVVPFSVRSLLGNPSSTIDGDDCFQINTVVGSCNGLVCLIGDSYQNIYLWNPATKLTSKYLAGYHRFKNYYSTFAFGYDNLSDTYKVVKFNFVRKAKVEIPVKIYSLGDNCWRNIHSLPAVPFVTPYGPRRNNGVYFNGTLNWLALCNFNSNDYKWNNTITIAQMIIVSLDLSMETFTQLLLPPLDEAPQAHPTIGVLMDCLCFYHDCNGTHFVLWQMKDFGVEKSWTQFMKVSYQDLQIYWWTYPILLFPLCTSDVLVMANNKLQAILYHRRDNRVQRIELPKYMCNYMCWSRTMDYVESLVSPCCN